MKSSILFKGGGFARFQKNYGIVQNWGFMFRLFSEIAYQKKEDVQVTIQHSLKEDQLAIMVELPHQTIAYHHRDPNKVVQVLSNSLLDHLRQFHEHQAEQEKKRAARKTGSRSHRRARPAR